MASKDKTIFKLEKDITAKMFAIKIGKITPKDSEIGKALNLMKSLDEPLYDTLLANYKALLEKIKQ